MLVWDETDVLTVLEVIPETERDGIWHKYSVKKDGMELRVLVYQYDGDVRIELFRDGLENSIFSMQLTDCSGVLRKNDTTGEYLEFAPAKCFESRYDGVSSIPYGVRIYASPSINISMFT